MIGALKRKVVRSLALALAPSYVAQAQKTRSGECDRCGGCCKIGFRCPFYDDANGCSIYDSRPPACRAFPIAPSDLLDVKRCSYTFGGSA